MSGMKRRRSVFVGADRGGCGKTFVTAALAAVHHELGGKPQIIEYEVEPRLGSILRGILPASQIDHRPSGFRPEDYDNDQVDARTFWDQVYERDLARGGLLFDTAANALTQAVMAWGDGGAAWRLEGGVDLGFVVVATAEQYAVKAASSTVDSIRHVFPHARIWLVENLRDGDFSGAVPSYLKLREREDLVTIQLPALKHNASARITEHSLSLLSGVTDDQLIELYGFGWAEAARSMERIRRFAVGAAEALLPVIEWMGQEELAKAPVPFRFNAG
jgi:hypothetical protein